MEQIDNNRILTENANTNVNSQLKCLFKQLQQRPVLVYPIYTKITGSVTAGLLLSQIVYWDSVMHGEFYKTDKEFREDLSMGIHEFRNAKRKLVNSMMVKVTVKGQAPPMTYYKLQMDLLIIKITFLDEIETKNIKYKYKKPICTKGANGNVQNAPIIYTESTSESKISNKSSFLSENIVTAQNFNLSADECLEEEKTKQDTRPDTTKGGFFKLYKEAYQLYYKSDHPFLKPDQVSKRCAVVQDFIDKYSLDEGSIFTIMTSYLQDPNRESDGNFNAFANIKVLEAFNNRTGGGDHI